MIEEWYRRVTWTKKDQEEFFAKLQKSRTSSSKAQYLRIQAVHLLQTQKKTGVLASVDLFHTVITDYPNEKAEIIASYEGIGDCCLFFNDINEAITNYKKCLEAEASCKNMQTNARYTLGKLLIELDRIEELVELEQFYSYEDHLIFPLHNFVRCGVVAVINDFKENEKEAIRLARLALEYAGERDNGLGRRKGKLGLVKNKKSKFHKRIVELANF